ncbi:Hexokinase type 2 [Pseudolycoriella hygida]|uniref:Phosphotransferase n=1 Tax=Pseudolycoriella hygida TaxID=35572 RepID=A0A9Q0S1I1_9DIPT|nr:Hexokinase type 2 [Pseudolycoriella hygida]
MVNTDGISPQIEAGCRDLVIDDKTMLKLTELILTEVNKGLSKAGNKDADVKCYETFINNLPTGTENGKFLALDLGGTNFRVLLIHLKGEKNYEVQSKTYAIPEHIMLGSGEHLFDHIADGLAQFVKDQGVSSDRLSLGFSFSFEMKQIALEKAILVKWAKGFHCTGVIGEDVVQLFNDAIVRRGDMNVVVRAVVNDTAGTLISCAWAHPDCRIGLVIGTGTNACYVEKIDFVENYSGPPGTHTIISTEWAGLGESGVLDFIRTDYDRDVDYNSCNRGYEIFEKMISGMYVGELVRLALCSFYENGFLFNGMAAEVITRRGSFLTKYMSEIESDESGVFDKCLKVLETLGLSNASRQDCINVRYICECVSRRAARLVSAGIAALINKIDESSVTVGVDGSVYRCHPKFHDLMVENIRKFVKPEISFNLVLSDDGSGCGAALVAAVACRADKTTANNEPIAGNQ